MKKTNPLKIVEIENIANKVRREFGVLLDSPFPILEVLEKLHYSGLLTIQYKEDDDPMFEEDTPAKYNPIDNFIYVKISVLEEVEADEYRANFNVNSMYFILEYPSITRNIFMTNSSPFVFFIILDS